MMRSMLFVPGNVEHRLAKALQLPADALIIDLEDSVPLTEKAAARNLATIALREQRRGLAYVRVNALATGMTIEDLNAVVLEGLDGIVLSKTEEAADLLKIDWYLNHLENKLGLPAGGIDLIPLVENSRGIINASAICAAVPRVKKICFGAIDYTADLGVKLTESGTELHYARSHLVNASRAAALEGPIDTVYPEIKNLEGYERDVRLGAALGFQGKLVLHPGQIEPANRIFSPTAEEIAMARKIVAAFEEAEARGSAAITLENGKFIDYPVARSARRTLEIAAQIEAKESSI